MISNKQQFNKNRKAVTRHQKCVSCAFRRKKMGNKYHDDNFSIPTIDVKYKIKNTGDVDYLEVGEWVSKDLFYDIVDYRKKEGKAIPYYDGVAIFEDDKMVKIKVNGSFEEV
jgi:hypothetical protein